MPAGTYVFGDYCTGEIFVIEGGVPVVALDTGMRITSFGEDESGEVYVVDHQGSVHRLIAGSGTPPPPTPCVPPTGLLSGPLDGLGSPFNLLAGILCPLGL